MVYDNEIMLCLYLHVLYDSNAKAGKFCRPDKLSVRMCCLWGSIIALILRVSL